MTALKAGSVRLTTAGKWAFYFVLIGLIAGLGSVVFYLLCQMGSHFLMDQLAGCRPPTPAGEPHLFAPTQTPFNRWMLLFLPALGGIVSGWLVYTFAPEAEGHGTDAAIDAYHNKGGFIRGRIPILKTIASAITLTSGGSGGREGPIAQIGAGFGSFLATRLKLSDRQRRIMLAAGMGAGVGSIFRAPLAGALFAAEVLYRDPEFESEVIIPAGISSVVAYCVFCLCFGWGSLFDTHDYLFSNPLELGPYTVLAFVLAGAGFLYVKGFYGVQHIAHSIKKIPNHIKPAIGGLLTGAIGFFFPQTLSFGYGFAQLALDNQLPTLFLLTLGFGKILTTSFSIGSGGSGGVFGPSVVIGGALGGAVGRIFHQIMPGIVTHPGAFVVVGMAGFFAGVSNTPISSIIIVSEMTNSYHLLLPGLLVCSLSYMLSRRWTIYEKQVSSKIDSNAHKGDFFVDILAAIRVRELTGQLRKVRLIPEDMTLNDFRKIFSSSDQQYFPVVDRESKMTGIFSINDIRGVIFDKEVGELVRMKDVANSNIIYTTPSEDLNEVFKKCTIRNLHRVPVVRDDDHSVLIGMLDRREMIQFYNQKVEEIKAGHEVEGMVPDQDVAGLRHVTVKEAMNPAPIPVRADMRLGRLKDLIYDRGFNSFPVVNASGRLEGILSLSDLKSAFKRGDNTLTAGDIATRRVVSVTGQESLLSALAKIAAGDFAILPVVERDQPDKLVGVISRSDIMKAFNTVILKRLEG
ncbi:MAG: chloride channel protein family [Thermodesulfobacteriota bacterium]|nr:chloride channel protein family [Thermodesulfobacteriota bacterium]